MALACIPYVESYAVLCFLFILGIVIQCRYGVGILDMHRYLYMSLLTIAWTAERSREG